MKVINSSLKLVSKMKCQNRCLYAQLLNSPITCHEN